MTETRRSAGTYEIRWTREARDHKGRPATTPYSTLTDVRRAIERWEDPTAEVAVLAYDGYVPLGTIAEIQRRLA